MGISAGLMMMCWRVIEGLKEGFEGLQAAVSQAAGSGHQAAHTHTPFSRDQTHPSFFLQRNSAVRGEVGKWMGNRW